MHLCSALQEVTPNINRMFRTFGWWDDYNCSDSSENAIEGDFCIVLSKFPIKAKRCVSSIARKLPGCELNVGIGRRLYVANGHLKRPNRPGMHCEIRKTQAKEAVKLLNCSRNAVFGGDMNWDEHRDGQFPLPKRWVDAWTRLKPNNNGWTYDTKSNKSLKGRKTTAEKVGSVRVQTEGLHVERHQNNRERCRTA
uniref:Endonuclease/exonuclease/phosphatase domain-containing protein n=1 Tax=Ananas comosus var. bracteatus TaxID=296719 RepID=A0A6V7PAV3_ANACO|nr:unnamed protein product [Ananas comosus var. bracteatus]